MSSDTQGSETPNYHRHHNRPYLTLDQPCTCCGSYSFIHKSGKLGTSEATFECFHCHVEK